jgi:hypothetical protein
VVPANAVRPIADLYSDKVSKRQDEDEVKTNLDRWDTEPLNSMGMPEADAGCQKNGFLSGQLLDDIVKVGVSKIRGSHSVDSSVSIGMYQFPSETWVKKSAKGQVTREETDLRKVGCSQPPLVFQPLI